MALEPTMPAPATFRPERSRPRHASFLAVALFASAVGAETVSAAPVEPWARDKCESFARSLTEAVRIPIKAAEGNPATVTDLAPAGTACIFSGNAKGLTQSHADAYGRLQKMLDGWDRIPEIAADGPDSVLQGFRKGDEQLIIELDRDPPAGKCKDVVQADCKVPAKRWLWTFKGAAYRR